MDLKDLTVVGWILAIITIAAGLGIGLPLMFMLQESLPPGRYPRILFMAPVLLVAAVVFFVGWGILAMLGIRIQKKSAE